MQWKGPAIVGALLIVGLTVQIATATECDACKTHRTPVAASQKLRAANNSIDVRRSTSCGTEPGNPYNRDTDYSDWSAWRLGGAWDSRNDCR
jgi:hypothetical protein